MNRYAADTACVTSDALPVPGPTLTGRIENYWSRRAESYGEIRRHVQGVLRRVLEPFPAALTAFDAVSQA